jgi:hypothetical protein
VVQVTVLPLEKIVWVVHDAQAPVVTNAIVNPASTFFIINLLC